MGILLNSSRISLTADKPQASQSVSTSGHPSLSSLIRVIAFKVSSTVVRPISPCISALTFFIHSSSAPTKRIWVIPLSFKNCQSACSCGIRSSRLTTNIVPLSTSLDTSMVPPINSTILLVIAMPSPVP